MFFKFARKINKKNKKTMERINNYITALWLIIYLPKMAYLWVRENWKSLAIAIGCVIALFIFSYNFGKSEAIVSPHHSTEYDGGFNFEDLTAAFATGDKRTMQVELIAIHHTAGNPNGSVSDLARIHLKQNQWNGIGYHFYITPDGTVYQLRPLDERCPHAYGCNDNAIAVCLAGNFNDYPVPDAQRTSALQLVRWLMTKYGLKSSNVLAHGELTNYSPSNATDCCGKLFNIAKFRQEL